MLKFSETLMISIDVTERDETVLTIGKLDNGKQKFVRCILGDEAQELFTKLMGSDSWKKVETDIYSGHISTSTAASWERAIESTEKLKNNLEKWAELTTHSRVESPLLSYDYQTNEIVQKTPDGEIIRKPLSDIITSVDINLKTIIEKENRK